LKRSTFQVQRDQVSVAHIELRDLLRRTFGTRRAEAVHMRNVNELLLCVSLGLVMVGCEVGDPDDKDTSETSQAITVGGLDGCTMYAEISQQDRNGFGEISCGNSENKLEVETCLEQLITGGWQTINWTCEDFTNAGTNDHHYLYTASGQVPYWTTNRWYQTQVWARVNGGAWGYLTSEGLKGP
jgi:hypothetical protein